MLYEYFFHIIDNEVNTEYDYQGYFEDHFEADKFISENEAVGNVVTIISPYYIEVPRESIDLNAL